MPNVRDINMGTSQYEIKSVLLDNWSHRNVKYNSSKVQIKMPKYHNRCWNITPPCTNNSNYLTFYD